MKRAIILLGFLGGLLVWAFQGHSDSFLPEHIIFNKNQFKLSKKNQGSLDTLFPKYKKFLDNRPSSHLLLSSNISKNEEAHNKYLGVLRAYEIIEYAETHHKIPRERFYIAGRTFIYDVTGEQGTTYIKVLAPD